MSAQDGSRFSLTDAVRNVNALDEMPLPDDVSCIQGANISVHHQVNYDTNFKDCDAFRTGVARYMEEAQVHAKLNELLEMGEEYAIMLYSWRSCSRALPPIRSNEQPNRVEIYQKTSETLAPYAMKLKNFWYFHQEAINRFCEEVKRLCHKEKKNDFVSEAYLLTLGKMLRMFALLDEMKNMKASMKNDYSHYRRAATFLRQHVDEHSVDESHKLSMFLAKQNHIRESLKSELVKIPGFEDLLAEIVNTCVFMYETKLYLLPEEKHTIVMVIGFCLYLIDTPKTESTKEISIYRMKKINIAKMDRIFKECEVVNLFGDMSICPFNYVTKAPTYDASKWPECNSSKISSQGNLLMHMPKFREEYTSLTADLAWHSNSVTTNYRETPRENKENSELCRLALRALQNLAAWSLQVLDTFTWKLAHCTDDHQNPDCPKDAEDYEKATRYNYNSEEKFALIEVISMIKSVQALLLRMETIYSEAIRRNIYMELQTFVQCVLQKPLHKAQKNKKEVVSRLICAIRATCMDQSPENLPPATDTLSRSSGKKVLENVTTLKMARRNVGPSSTQLYMVRTMLESMIDRSSSGKHTLKKDIDGESLMAFDNFHKTSFFWPYLLNFNGTLFKCCDLSQLWYREFYLEMTNGVRIQFPIEMSIPWILTSHILETQEPAFMEYLLFPLDLYNDSAWCALNRFKCQFLYDEMEAEINLVFDQLVYKLSEQIFVYYKQYASSILLDKRFRAECIKQDIPIKYPQPNRYVTLMKQRHVQLLGRSVDLNRLISQRMNKAILDALDSAILRFQSSNITGIMELECLIEINKLCHRMLSEYLELDSFESIFKEANHNVTSPLGRIALHVFWELIYDLVPNYCYNGSTNRFVTTKMSFSPDLERDKMPTVQPQYLWGSKPLAQCYETIFKLYSGFFGGPHIRIICRLLGYQGIFVVISEILKICNGLIRERLKKYIDVMSRAMPEQLKQHKPIYGSEAIFTYYYARLKNIFQYPDLRTDVCQCFRELGNIIIFCLLIEQSLSIEETVDLKHASPFVGILPKAYIPPPEDRGTKPPAELRKERELQIKEVNRKMEQKYAPLNVANVVAKLGTPEQAAVARDNDILTRERLCCGLVMFEQILTNIRGYLDEDPIWQGAPPKNGVMEVDECTEFHRLWSAIQFVFCTPLGENEFTVEELFGEGLNWAGCALIILLDQDKRFEALDIGYNLVRMNKMDQKDAILEGVSLKKMVERVRKFQILNNQIFATLKKHLSNSERQNSKAEAIRHFPPLVFR